MKKILFTLLAVAMGTWTMAQCSANFTFSVSGGTATFTDLSSVPAGSDYYWNFGDGGTSSAINPTYTYSANGLYAVCLWVVDSTSGCSDYYCDSLDVTGLGGGGGSIFDSLPPVTGGCIACGTLTGPPPCNADFVMYPDSSTTNTWYFYSISTGGAAPFTYSWDFGDGSTSSSMSPTHTYATSGTYTVCLTYVTDSCSSTVCYTISFMNGEDQRAAITEQEEPSETPITLSKLYPNPAQSSTTISVNAEEDSQITLVVTGITGQALVNEVRMVAKGENQISLNVDDLPVGNYYVTITTANGRGYATTPFIKVQ